jgi:hypothetical protein
VAWRPCSPTVLTPPAPPTPGCGSMIAVAAADASPQRPSSAAGRIPGRPRHRGGVGLPDFRVMSNVDLRLVAALRQQLSRRPADAARVGWKHGGGDDERIGGEIAVGHLTSSTTLENGGTYVGGGQDLHADVEVAVEIGAEGEISTYGVALEFCDLADGGTSEEVVAKNDYHRAVAFGPFVEALPAQLEAVLVINGERHSAGPAPTPTEIADRVAAVNRVLGSVGETLRLGDRVITGLIVNGPVSPGDEVVAELVPIGCVRLHVDSESEISR